MTKDVLVMALSAFLHDIGKFAQRADMPISDDFKNGNLYCNLNKENNISSDNHSLYTALFIDWLEKEIPTIFKNQNIDNISLINLASAHHKPQNPLEQIIAIANELSNGFDKKEFTSPQQTISDKDTRLVSIFEEIDMKDDSSNSQQYSFNDYKYKYPLKPLDPQNIFPKDNNDSGSYIDLFENFKKEILKLAHTDNLELWFEHFDSLFMKYTSAVPSASFTPDISLYDHCKTTSAFASALYLYHKHNNTLTEENINNSTENKFIYLKSKFHGIQNFIFSQGGETNKNSAKILRGRSFYISLLMELAGDMLCKNTGVPHTSIVMNAAGGVTMILPNTADTKTKIEETEAQINDWLIKNFYGEVSIGFAYIETSYTDFKFNNQQQDILGTKINEKLEIKKFQKINTKYFGKIENYFDNNDVLCKFCGKRPAKKTGKTEKCPICKDLTNIGEKLVKQSKIIIINPSDTDNNILKVPIFDKYGVCFEDDKNTYLQTNTADSLIKYWTFSINNITTTFKQFNAYVPKDQEGAVKTFEDIVANDDMKKGIKALGILKCDVDNLGKIFQIGISKRHGSSLSKIATFSRVMNSFFTIYLPNLLSTNPKYNNIYTVFAGGDDLFLIGRWDTIIELSYELKNAFNNFSCHNKQVTFSAGIAIAKPNEMIRSFYFYSEQALKQSKDNAGKDSLTIFNETIKWSQKDEMTGISDNLSKWQKSEILNSAALFKILSFIDMAQKSDNISKKIGNISVNLNDMQNFKWKALLNYFLTRNNAVKKQPSIVRDFVNQIDSNSRSSLKIAIWQNIYKNRIRG